MDADGLADGVRCFLRASAACGPLEARFVHVLPDLTAAGTQQCLERMNGAAALCNRLRDEMRDTGFKAQVEVRMGETAHEIAKMALTESAGLIVMSTHGRTGIDRLLHGSMAESVLRLSPVPVLIANERERPHAKHEGYRIRRILWAVHDPVLDDELHPIVARTARLFTAEVLLYHRDFGLDDQDGSPLDTAFAAWADACRRRLEGEGVLTRVVAVSAAQAGEDVRRAVPGHQAARLPLRAPNVADAIVQRVRDLGADLLVMGTHGRAGLARGLFGSVAEDAVRHCPCPVLLKRPARRDAFPPNAEPFVPV